MTSKCIDIECDQASGGGAKGFPGPSLSDLSGKKTKDARPRRASPRLTTFSPDQPLPDANSNQMLLEENTSLKTSIQCIKVVKKLLKDRDVSLSNLEKTVREFKLCIEHLQARLHRNKLDSSVNLKDNEIFVPGHDKEILKDLLNETVRLRRIIDAKYSSEEVAEAQETIDALREVVSELSKKLKLKENEFDEHLSEMKGSDDERNAVISKLRCELRQYYTQRAYDDDVRLTLSAEVDQMKSKIEVLVDEMGNMAKELKVYEEKERVKHEEKKMLERQEKFLSNHDSGLSLKDECKSLQEQTVNLTRENRDLSKQVKDVISMNTRWQKYSDQREAYVVQLTTNNQMKVSENKVLDSKCHELMRKIDELNTIRKEKECKQKDAVDAAVISLETDLGRSQQDNIKLHQKIAMLEKHVQQQRSSSQTEQAERIMLLETQVAMSTEDFEAERKDRTDLQARYQKLMENNDQLKYQATKHQEQQQQLLLLYQQQQQQYHQQQQYQQQQQQKQPRFNPYSMASRCGFNEVAANQQSFLPQRVEADGGQDLLDCDFADPGQSSKKSPELQRFDRSGIHGDDNADGSVEEDDDLLRCPRCFKRFRFMEHALLVDHVDTCDGQDDDDLEIG